MSVRFILGRSGTGKTSYCVKAIVESLLAGGEEPLILLVPEQATYQAERAILSDKRIAGYSRCRVLSFDRLGFFLRGKNTAMPALSRTGGQMIIQRILRERESELRVLGASVSRVGMGKTMADTVVELHRYAKTPEDIETLLVELEKDEKNKAAALKFADIGLVLREYLKFIEGRFIDPDMQLLQSSKAVAQADFVKGARLWVDGFAGFTTAELIVLAELVKTVKEAQIALCLDASRIDLANVDSGKIDPADLFNPTERTYAELLGIVKKCKIEPAEPIILNEAVRFSSCGALAHIERNIFEPAAAKCRAADNIRIAAAANRRAEVQFVARRILELVKEKGLRYRDIAVIASTLGDYQHYIRGSFEDYGIPFFIDERKTLNLHPLVQFVCSALAAVTGGFRREDIFAYLKTDLVAIERCEVDLLENYCVAFGINAADWTDEREWHFEGEEEAHFDEQRINEIRQKVAAGLLELYSRLCPDGENGEPLSAVKFTGIVFDFLDKLNAAEQIDGWIEEAIGLEDFTTADEHRQFYDKFVSIFDELVEVFGQQQIKCEDLISIITSAFSELTLAFIPPRLDEVLVGSIERSRHPDLKAVFLIGATQKHFPSPVVRSSLLTDDDRFAAEAADFELAPTVSQTLAERQYLAYIAFTRPSEFLYVTYPLTDDKGRTIARSGFVSELESLFEDLEEESIAEEQIGIEQIHNEGELADLLCSRLGKDVSLSEQKTDGRLGRLLEDMCSDEELAELGAKVILAINYDNSAKLDKKLAAGLFGRRIKSSATRLSTFAACPYQFFARYILELEERKEFKFEPLDVGIFYHSVLDVLLKRLSEEGRDFATIEGEQLIKLLREEISAIVRTDSFISNFVRHSKHNAFIIHSAGEVLEDCVLAIAAMVRAGSFRPIASEVVFGDVGDEPGGYELGLSDNRQLILRGKIDRLDVAELEGGKIGIVFDYKRRDKTFSWAKFYYGLDMQLPIYMLAVRAAGESQYKIQDVVGAFYMPVETGLEKVELNKLSDEAEGFNRKAKGIFNGQFARLLDGNASKDSRFYNFYVTKDGEPYGVYGGRGALRSGDFEKVLRFAEGRIVELAGEIVSGKIDIAPYRIGTATPCGYCKYRAVCRFDWQVNDYRPLRSLMKEAVLEEMGGIDG